MPRSRSKLPQHIRLLPLLLTALLLSLGIAASAMARNRQPPLGLDTYQSTQGQSIAAPLAPYVEEFLDRGQIGPRCVLDALFPQGEIAAGTDEVLISSAAHITGLWTYFASATTRVYVRGQVPGPGAGHHADAARGHTDD